jgi:uncharacterized protein YndB with AHSA1/START domain
MELKTKIAAEDGKQDLVITREFELPVDLLFRAYAEPEILEEWMGSKVVKLESQKNGSYQLEKKDENGNVVFAANGVIHEFVPNKKIIRTFEMANTPFGVQLEVYDFEPLGADNSKLTMHVIFESGTLRDKQLQLPFKQGLNWAHNQLETTLRKRIKK